MAFAPIVFPIGLLVALIALSFKIVPEINVWWSFSWAVSKP